MRQSKFCLLLMLLIGISVKGFALTDPAKVWGKDGKTNAYEKNWYSDSSSSLTIENANQLGSFIKALNENKTFEGKTVTVNADLDMSAFQWAATSNVFKGIFDGNGHTISNLKLGDDSSPWAFIGSVDGGEVKNVIISGSFTGNGEVGGIVGNLSNGGKITNTAYIGNLMSTVPSEGSTVKVGGIVGNNDGGIVSNSFYSSGGLIISEGTELGNIAGTSSVDGIVNSYFLENDKSDRSIGTDETTIGLGQKTADEFASGEVAWLLNQGNDNLKWSFNGERPVFASETNPAVYKNTYVASEFGTIEGEIYVKEGAEVTLTTIPVEGYLLENYDIVGAEVEVEGNIFKMPAADITVSGQFAEYIAPVILEATNIGSSGFTANWSAAGQGVTEYLLTVTTADGTVLDAYNKLSVGDVTSYEVTNLLPETAYKYYVQAKNGNASSQISQETSLQTLVGPVISYSPVLNTFKLDKDLTISQTITVLGSNLTSDITLALAGENADNFSISTETLPANGGDLTITYTSDAPAIHAAVLTLSSIGAGDVTVNLNGIAEVVAPKPVVALVGKLLFHIKWDAVLFAESYSVTLLKDGVPVAGYENVATTECQYEFSGLKANTAYTFIVSSIKGEEKFASDEMSVKTTIDYGQQLNNSGFEYWEGSGDNAEPVDWNSFMTANASSWATDMAKTCHMKPATDLRPNSAGTTSVRIWSEEPIKNTIANGNLTCGRINAGSTTPTDEENHNYTVVGDPNFSEEMYGAKPDSLTVWVKFVPSNEADEARVAAYIHDTYNFKDPSSNAENNSHIVGKAIMNYPATADKGWQRLSIPFEYCGPAASADYMLVTYSTNKDPGKGTKNDEVYIDDMLLVYNPKVQVTTVDKSAYQRGETINVSYNLEGTMSPTNLIADPNIVKLQLSDKDGNFGDSPLELASVVSDYSGTLTGVIPEDLELGDNYRVRIVTTNYPMTSEPNTAGIKVYIPGTPTIVSTSANAFLTTVNTSVAQTITVTGSSLTEGITIALDNNTEGFSIDNTSLPLEGGEIVVTYNPSSVGANAAILTLTSTGAETVTVELNGTSKPKAPVVAAATDITPIGFTANWEAVDNATVYELSIKPSEGDAINKIVNDAVSSVVTGLQPSTEYTYSVVAKVGELASESSEESDVVTTLAKPSLTVDPDALTFGETIVGQSAEKQTITVAGIDLLGDITVTVAGNDFTVSETNISKDEENKTVDVTFTPVIANTMNEGTLTLATPYADDVVVTLKASSIPQAVVALPATAVEATSFTANWEAITGATYYYLTVLKEGTPLENYNNVRVRKTSLAISNLEPLTLYTYTLTASVNNLISAVSNEIEVTTASATGINNTISASALVYPNPVNDILYIEGCEAKEISVYSIDGMYVAKLPVEESKVNVSSLSAGSYLVTVICENGQIYKTRIIKK